MEDILKKIGIILDQENILKLLEILDEIHVHPKYEYIEVYFDSWKSFFRNKTGLIVSGAYSGKRECQTLIEGLNQLGIQGWKVVHFKSVLINLYDTYAVGDSYHNYGGEYFHDKDGLDYNREGKYKNFFL